MTSIWTIVVGAGSGSRFGGLKQLEIIGDLRVVDMAVRTASLVSDGVTLLAPRESLSEFYDCDALVIAGGATRSESVRLGLASVPTFANFVLVHDAARPLASVSLYKRVIGSLRGGAQAVVPLVQITDSLKRIVADGKIESLSRDGIFGAQTPQGFTMECLLAISQYGEDTTDDVGGAEMLGVSVMSVPGEVTNLKITTPGDLILARAIVANENMR